MAIIYKNRREDSQMFGTGKILSSSYITVGTSYYMNSSMGDNYFSPFNTFDLTGNNEDLPAIDIECKNNIMKVVFEKKSESKPAKRSLIF